MFSEHIRRIPYEAQCLLGFLFEFLHVVGSPEHAAKNEMSYHAIGATIGRALFHPPRGYDATYDQFTSAPKLVAILIREWQKLPLPNPRDTRALPSADAATVTQSLR